MDCRTFVLACLSAFAAAGGAARAETITYTFTGTVTSDGVHAGQSFSGMASFDDSAVDVQPYPGFGHYVDALTSLSLTVEGSTYAIAGSTESVINVYNDFGSDALEMFQSKNDGADAVILMATGPQTLWDSEALPIGPLDPAAFNNFLARVWIDGAIHWEGTIASVTFSGGTGSGAMVPLPGAAWAGLTLLGVLGGVRAVRRVPDSCRSARPLPRVRPADPRPVGG